MPDDPLPLLRLLQLADSALPVGSAAHSFGLESLIEDGLVTPESLESYLRGHLEENGPLDAGFCRAAHELSRAEFESCWHDLNAQVSARKAPRESREASLALGRRFLNLASNLLGSEPCLAAALDSNSHHVTAFGLVASLAGIDQQNAVVAWLHQSVTALVSAAQRLMPLGQTQASQIIWRLKPLLSAVGRTGDPQGVCFTPLTEIASMRHSKLVTRLFIS